MVVMMAQPGLPHVFPRLRPRFALRNLPDVVSATYHALPILNVKGTTLITAFFE